MLAKLFTYIFMGAFMGRPLLTLIFHGRIILDLELCMGFCVMCEEGFSCDVSFLWCRTLNHLYPSQCSLAMPEAHRTTFKFICRLQGSCIRDCYILRRGKNRD